MLVWGKLKTLLFKRERIKKNTSLGCLVPEKCVLPDLSGDVFVLSPTWKTPLSHRSCRTHRIGAVTPRQSIVSLVLRALHPWKLTWIPKMAIFERRNILKPSFLVFMLDFGGGGHWIARVIKSKQRTITRQLQRSMKSCIKGFFLTFDLDVAPVTVANGGFIGIPY